MLLLLVKAIIYLMDKVLINKLNLVVIWKQLINLFTGLCIADLSDFDNALGQKSVENVVKGIEELDVEIPMMLNKLTTDDLLILTFDLGHESISQSSEPQETAQVILYSRNFKEPKALKPFDTLADIGATIADNFDVQRPNIGTSILDKLK